MIDNADLAAFKDWLAPAKFSNHVVHCSEVRAVKSGHCSGWWIWQQYNSLKGMAGWDTVLLECDEAVTQQINEQLCALATSKGSLLEAF